MTATQQHLMRRQLNNRGLLSCTLVLCSIAIANHACFQQLNRLIPAWQYTPTGRSFEVALCQECGHWLPTTICDCSQAGNRQVSIASARAISLLQSSLCRLDRLHLSFHCVGICETSCLDLQVFLGSYSGSHLFHVCARGALLLRISHRFFVI